MDKDFKVIPPFRRCVIQNFPFIEEDFDALTNYSLLSKIVEYLNTVIKSQNEVTEEVEYLANAYNQLKNYVDHYFDNLDVQEEIDEKLDEMADSGELADIIAQYLGLAGVLAFDTIADLAGAENVVAGSIARVLGNTNYADGDGAFYRVRALVNTDVIDGVDLVAITNAPTLVAERIPDPLADRVSTLETTVGRMTGRKFLFIGDSYGTGDNELGQHTTSWTTLVPQYLGLTVGTNCLTNSVNGSGFNAGYGFKTQLQDLSSTVPDVNTITDIVIVGGYNDKDSSVEQIDSKMAECFSYAKTTYPNAQIMLACVGWSKVYLNRQANVINSLTAYTGCGKYGVKYLKNTEYILHDYSLFSDDSYHPNQNGQNELSKYLAEAIISGTCAIKRWIGSDIISKVESGDTLNPDWCLEYQNDGTITVSMCLGYIVRSTSYNIGNLTKIPLAIIESGLCLGSGIQAINTWGNILCATGDSSTIVDIAGEYSIEYDATNNRAVVYWQSAPQTTTTNNITCFLTTPISLTFPASYC